MREKKTISQPKLICQNFKLNFKHFKTKELELKSCLHDSPLISLSCPTRGTKTSPIKDLIGLECKNITS